MQGDGGRFEEGGIAEAHTVGDNGQVAHGRDEVLGKAAIHPGPDEAVIRALGVVAEQALGAVVARQQRGNSHPPANQAGVPTLTDGRDLTSDLVSENERVEVRAVAEHARDVGAADPCSHHANQRLTRSGFGRGDLLHTHVTLPVQHSCQHQFSIPQRSKVLNE